MGLAKKPENRIEEILDTAERMFLIKGYDSTSTNDIVESLNIARGTLYYYFKSKDDILNAVIDRIQDRNIQKLNHIINDNKLNALEKINHIIILNRKINDDPNNIFNVLKIENNEIMHMRILVESVRKFTKIYTEIVKQGIEEGLFTTKYPLEISEFTMIITNFLFNPGIFKLSEEEILTKLMALADLLEKTLEAPKDSFSFIYNLIPSKSNSF